MFLTSKEVRYFSFSRDGFVVLSQSTSGEIDHVFLVQGERGKLYSAAVGGQTVSFWFKVCWMQFNKLGLCNHNIRYQHWCKYNYALGLSLSGLSLVWLCGKH